MSFDPDAFLAETAPDNGAAFDPDAFLAETDPGLARGMGMPLSSANDENGVLGHVQDAAVSLAKGVVGVPELAVGLLDIPTGGRVGKFLENEGGAIGFRPGQAKEFLSEGHTDQYRSQQEAFSNADGVMEKAKVAIAHPALIGNTVIESLPSMGAGGAAARGVMAGSKALGMVANPAVAGAVGEGLAMAGAQAESTRQQTEDGLLTAKQSALAAATGVGGALFGFAGGKLAQRLGIGDVDTMLARGVEPDAVVQEIAKLPAKSIPRQIIEGAISEGLFEELPQSVAETISQNMALDRPWHEGIEDSIVMGTLAGMAMGGPAAGFNGVQQNRARKAFEKLGGVQAQQELMDEQIAEDNDSLVSGEDALKKAAAKGASLEDVVSMEQERAAGLDALKQKQAARAALKEKELAAQAEVDDALAEQQAPSVQDQLRADADLPIAGKFQPATAADDVATKAAPRSTREVVRDWQDMGVLNADITESDGTITIGRIEMQEGASGTAEDALQHLTNYAKAAGKQLVQKEVAQPRNDQPAAGVAPIPEAAPAAVDSASGKDGQDLAGMQQQLLPAAQNQEQHSAGPVAESRAAALEAADGEVASAQGSTVPDTTQAAEIEAAAHVAATSPANDLPEPTQAQKEAGNYKKGHIKLHGLDITVENPRGSTRSGQREDGSTWEHEMSDHYGYIKRTEGADGEQVDVYVGPQPESGQVFVIDQLDQKSGQFDEHKAMLGFGDEASAIAAYRSNFDEGWKVGPVRAMSMDEFKQWVKEGDTRKPVAGQPTVKESLTDQGQQAVVPAAETVSAQDSASTAPPGGDGWVPRLSSKGKPFSGAALAERSARENKFPEYRIEPVEGGFAIMLPPAAPADSAAEEKPTSLGRQIISSKKKTRARLELRAQHFTPGNIISGGYDGSADRVLQYEDDGKGDWRVQVEAVQQQPDGSWKATGEPRWHRTEPDKRDRLIVAAKPAAAAQPVQEPAITDRRKVDRRLVDPTAALQDEARKAMEKAGMAPEQAAKAAAAVKASTDELLGNTYYTHHLVPAIERAQKSGVPYAYYHVEMENLGGLNKIIGSAVQTDDELAALAREIRNITPDGVLVSHGGSNFGLLVPADQMALVDKELADISSELAERGMELAKQHGYDDVPGKGGGKDGLGLLYKGEQIDPKADPGKIITDVKKAATPDEVGGTQHVNGTQIQESWARSLPGGNARVQSGTFAYSGKTPEAGSGRSGARGSLVQQPGRETSQSVERGGLPGTGQAGRGNRKALVGRKALQGASELRRGQLEGLAQKSGVGEGQLEEFARFFDEAKLDDTTGLWAKTELRPLFDDAIRVVNDGTPVQYVSVDISNLSGMNKGLSRNEKDSRKLADILFKAITDMTREKLDATGASVQGIRQGGDEISFFVAGVEMAAVQQAMNDAKQDIADWLETTGYSKLPHLKSYTPEVLAGTAERDTSKDGSGIYVGISQIKADTKLRDALEKADTDVGIDKDNPKPAPRTTFDPEAWKYLPVQTLDGKPLADEGGAAATTKPRGSASQPKATPVPRTAPKTTTAAPAAPIEDAGAQLVWNRKGLFKSGGLTWDSIQGENDTLKLKMATKEKVWARPDWEQLVNAVPEEQRKGFALVAHLVKQVYDGIPKGPTGKTDEHIQQYLSAVAEVREAANDLLNNKAKQKALADALAAQAAVRLGRRTGSGGSMLDMLKPARDRADMQPLYAALFPEQAAGGRFVRGTPANDKGVQLGKAVGAMQFTINSATDALKAIDKQGWPAKQEAWQKQGYHILAGDSAKVDYYEYSAKGEQRVAASLVLDNDSRPTTVVRESFPGKTREDQDVQDWAAQQLEQAKGRFVLLDKRGRVVGWADSQEAAQQLARDTVRRSSNPDAEPQGEGSWERVGPERRAAGENISSEQLKDAFGFRGVNFGNWVKQAERQEFLNAGYDALLDLADVLGVPPRALSLNGMVGIAFGAQGRGGAATAHFVPGVNEINLTKTAGAGALAHEWGHALDHYFGVMAGLAKAPDPFASHLLRYGGRAPSGDLRSEVSSAIKALIITTQKTKETPAAAMQRVDDYVTASTQDFGRLVERLGLRDKLAGKPEAEAALAELEAGKPGDDDWVALPPPKGKRKSPGGVFRQVQVIGEALAWGADQMLALHRKASSVAYAVAQKEGQVELRDIHTDFYRASRNKDASKQKPYWSTEHEMFARAFESWVMDKLAEKSFKNDFLVRPNKDDAGTTNPDYPYPAGEERKTFNKAFDILMKEVQVRMEKGSDGQDMPVLFNKQEDGIAMPVAGIDRATADTVVANFLKDYQGAKRLSIRIFDDKVQAYGMAKLAFNKMLDARIKGSFGNGQLQLILDAHDSAEDLLRTLRHEVWAHYGMDLLNDAQKKRLRLSLEILRLESPELRSLWKNRVLRDYSNASYEVQTEELLAAVAEEYGDLVDARAKENALTRTVRKAFRILRDLLAKIGVVRQADGLDKVVDMLADSAGRMRKDTVPGTEAAEMRFNKQEPGSGEPTAITLLDASKHPKGTERAELIPVVGNLSNLLKEHGVQVRISDSMNGWPANIRNQADEHAAVVVAGKTIFVAADMLDSKHDLTLAILRDIRRRTGKTRPADIVAEINSHLRRLPSGEQVAKLKNLSIDQMKRSSLALLTLRQLTDIGQKYLPGLQAYSVMHGKMVGSRNAMMNAVGEHVKHWEKWSGRKENRAMANQLHDLMNDSTRMGVDPSVDYMPLTTPEETKATIKMLNEQARGLGGDSRMIAKIIEKKKAAKAKLAHEQERAEAYPDLRKRWEALSGEAQAIYTNSRDMMTQRRHDMLKALEDRIADEIADHEQRKVMIDRLRLEFESNRVDPYFPLFRHGNYWVAIKDGEGNNQAFHMFDTEAEWQEFKDGYEATGHTVAAGKNIENLMSERGVDPGFVADVSDLLNDLPPGTSERLRDEVYQLYLQTLPNLSMRKHFIHRQGTKGYSRDALHAFAHNSFHGIHQLAKLQYGYKLGKIVAAAEEAVRIAADPAKLAKLEEDVLDAMDAADAINAQEDARASDKEALNRLAGDMAQLLMDAERSAKNTPRAADLVSEMKQRHDWVMNPKMSAWAQRSSSAAFMFYLGFSPAAALVNTSQVPLMTLPVLAERFGMAKSGAMITKVTKEFFASGIDKRGFFSLAKTLQGDELKAYQYFLDQGVFESLAHDIAGVAENGALNSEVGAKVMAAASWGFHKAEVFNREVTAFAGYRLARESGASHDVALRYAEKLVWDTQFDYSNANRARFMQNNWMKVFTQFKQYAFSVLYLWGRAAHQSIKGETPEVQKMARKRLRGLALMNFLGAGLFGMLPDPLYQAAKALIALTMGDDDDDPIDVEAEMRQMIAELMGDLLGNEAYGRKAAQAITGGVGNAAGIDLASRIGISHLLFQDDGREAEGRDQYLNLLEAFGGPVPGILKNLLLGGAEFADGNWMRGVEKVLPAKGFRDLAKAARYATEGARTRRGDELVEDVELGEIMVQAIGFSPVRIADQYDQNNANMNRKTKLDDRKRDLTDSYIRALKEKDGERRTEVMAEITAFNQKNPDRAITGSHIQRVMAGRLKYSAKAQNGIVAPREYDFAGQ